MKVKGSAVERTPIPGGRLLGQYIGKIMAVYVRKHFERERARWERQRVALTETKCSLQGVDVCRGCLMVLKHTDLVTCATACAHGNVCSDCRVGKLCKKLCCQPCRAPNCGFLCPKNDGRHICTHCQSYLCADHREFCMYCGDVMCTSSAAPTTSMLFGYKSCRERHVCDQGRKRAKKE